MKIHVRTQRTVEGWQLSIAGLRKDAEVLTLCRAKRFPLPQVPPPGAPVPWKGMPHEQLCEDVEEAVLPGVHRAIMRSEATASEVQAFGLYLFTTLFGHLGPEIITAAAKLNGDGWPALTLQFEPDDHDLQWLPWELMHHSANGTAPLASHDPPFSFRRIVGSTGAALQPLELPLRVLFVISNHLDPGLRAGAEYLGLLQRLRMSVSMPATDGEAPEVISAGLHLRLLYDAERSTLQTAVDEFRPQVVHFVCHGEGSQAESRVRLRKPLQPHETVRQDDPCNAQVLAGLLKGTGGALPLPQAVMLNACHTGNTRDGYMALAAELVRLGVPLAIGMSGEVTDAACREFSGAFYEALAGGKSIDQATAIARRTAMLRYQHSLSDVDWCRPIVYTPGTEELKFEVNATLVARVRAASEYRVRDEGDVFCDRLACMDEYQKFLRGLRKEGGHVALIFESLTEDTAREEKYGKTRTLDELIHQSVLDGFVPCVLRPNPKLQDVPVNLLGFALEVARELDQARRNFGLKPRVDSRVARLAFRALGLNEEFDPHDAGDYLYRRDQAEGLLRKSGPSGPGGVGKPSILHSLEADVQQILHEIRSPKSWAALLIVIDNLELLGDLAVEVLRSIGNYGFGTKEAPAPLLMSYSPRLDRLLGIEEQLKSRSRHFRRVSLKAFEDTEARLAYAQYLASLTPPCLVNCQSTKERVEVFFEEMHDIVKGVPSKLRDGSLQRVVRMCVVLDVLASPKLP